MESEEVKKQLIASLEASIDELAEVMNNHYSNYIKAKNELNANRAKLIELQTGLKIGDRLIHQYNEQIAVVTGFTPYVVVTSLLKKDGTVGLG